MQPRQKYPWKLMMKDVDEMFCQKDVEKILCQRRPGWNQVKLGDIVKFEKYQHYKRVLAMNIQCTASILIETTA